MAPKHAFILAGGQSRRFGSDKTEIRYNGILLVDMLIKTLRMADCFPIILGQPKPHMVRDIDCLPDITAFQGPLAAIAGAFERLNVPRALVVAADMPFITPDIIHYMWKQSGHLIHFESSPLPAVYTIDCLSSMRQLLNRGIRSLWPLDAHIPQSIQLTSSSHTDAKTLRQTLININTEHDLEQALDMMHSCHKISFSSMLSESQN